MVTHSTEHKTPNVLTNKNKKHMKGNVKNANEGSGCGSVGRAVASDTRDPQFESSHWQTFIKNLFIVNCAEKTKKVKKKEAGNGLFKKR